MEIECIPVLRDSMSYIIIDNNSHDAAIVDAADINRLSKVVDERKLNVTAVLSTSNTWEHARDNEEVKRRFPNATIYGSRFDQTRAMDKSVKQGDKITVGTVQVTVKDAHAFTEGSLIFIATCGEEADAVFTGGTLLCGGAGIFTHHAHRQPQSLPAPAKKGNVERAGGAQAMFRVLHDIMGSMSDDSCIYPGYLGVTNNLKFAAQVEPENEDIQQRLQDIARMSEADAVPTTLGWERKTNPFLRLTEDSVRSFVGHAGRKEHSSQIEILDVLAQKFQESGLGPRMQTA